VGDPCFDKVNMFRTMPVANLGDVTSSSFVVDRLCQRTVGSSTEIPSVYCDHHPGWGSRPASLMRQIVVVLSEVPE